MSLAQLDSQIEDLRAKAASIQKHGTRTRDGINKDPALSDVGKREQIEKARAQLKAELSALSSRERELIDSKRESLERHLFGLSSAARSDPNQLIAYRDAQERATKLPDSAAGAALLASAARLFGGIQVEHLGVVVRH